MLSEIRERLARLGHQCGALPDGGGSEGTRAAGIGVHLATAPAPPVPVLFSPMLYLVFQGSKRLTVGDRQLSYGAGTVVTMSVDLPAVVEVTEASPRTPYLSLEMPVERDTLTSLIAEMPARRHLEVHPVGLHPLPSSVLEPTARLLRLAEAPDDARVLAAGVRREILYRLLVSPAGDLLRSQVAQGPDAAGITRTTRWLQDNLAAPTRVEDLAAMASMSVTSFHRRFKQATGTTPVSYHKTVRLHEARRLLAVRADSVATIAAAVGYRSPSQFSRDYKRAFGTPPSAEPAAVTIGTAGYVGAP